MLLSSSTPDDLITAQLLCMCLRELRAIACVLPRLARLCGEAARVRAYKRRLERLAGWGRIAAGETHNCPLRHNGRVVEWPRRSVRFLCPQGAGYFISRVALIMASLCATTVALSRGARSLQTGTHPQTLGTCPSRADKVTVSHCTETAASSRWATTAAVSGRTRPQTPGTSRSRAAVSQLCAARGRQRGHVGRQLMPSAGRCAHRRVLHRTSVFREPQLRAAR
mmetsp:Transcript_3692/g.14451  ORF Transcript_3692/g.14451 Transcript_3692/m.14451 type:complete len:224 (+) Transcript_3692:138-809(+)